tara:strand:+ start:3707 stop:4360 length:654 start_codon:yes stop_codon:yes gene_type:complete
MKYVKFLLKKIFLYKKLKQAYHKLLYIAEIRKFKKYCDKQKKLKIIIGASETKYEGWISTNEILLNLINEKTFNKILKKDSVDNFLAEHVFEHLTENEGKIAIENCYQYLKPGGIIRIAVPDGFFPDPKYINSTKPGGSGPGAYDHKVLYNYLTIKEIFDQDKFVLNFVEYFNQDGKFNEKKLSDENGFILRSRYNDERNNKAIIKYTSLIVDAIKI